MISDERNVTSPSLLVMLRIARGLLRQRYSPQKIKERVEAGLYLVGLLALLLLPVAVLVFIVGRWAGLPRWTFPNADDIKNAPPLFSWLKPFWIAAVDNPLAASAFLLLFVVSISFVIALVTSWRRHVFESTFSSTR